MGKYIKLSPEQKDEIRRLTQLANRRIRNAMKAYEKEGKMVVPREIAGKHQTRDSWSTSKTPISRTVKFTSQKEYRQQLHYLRQFEVARPGIKEYTEIQKEKVGMAMKTALGEDVSFKTIQAKLAKLTAPQLADFWNTFSDKAARLGMNYSSEAVMEQTFVELFPEDLYSTLPA